MKYILLALVLSCVAKVQDPLPPVVTPVTPPATEVATALGVKVNLVKLTDFNEAQADRFKSILVKVETILNSPEFKSEVLGHTHKGAPGFFDSIDTPAKVYETLTAKPWQIEYIIKYRRFSTSTIGYTYPSVSWVAIYADKFRSMADCQIAANVAHEYSHKLGYTHSMKWTKDRPYSVPYGLGAIVEGLCSKL